MALLRLGADGKTGPGPALGLGLDGQDVAAAHDARQFGGGESLHKKKALG